MHAPALASQVAQSIRPLSNTTVRPLTEYGATLYELRDALGCARKADVSLTKLAADAALETYAHRIRKREPSLSMDAAYVRAMNEHPDVADLAVNG